MNFSIKDAFAFGWHSTRDHFLQVLVVLGISLGINWLLRFLFDGLVDASTAGQTAAFALITLMVIVFEVLVQIGVIKEILCVVRGAHPDLHRLLSHRDFFFKVLAGWIVYGLFIFLVCALSFLPFLVIGAVAKMPLFFVLGFLATLGVAVYAIITFSFARLIVVDHGSSPLQSLRLSEEITRGNRAKILLFFVLSGLLNLGGFLLFFLGLIVTIPVSFFALIWVYEQLLAKRLTAGQK